MGRLQRVHAPHGIYYVQLRVNSGQVLFPDEEDVAEFNLLVANALSICDARLLAFCWTASEARFAVQVSHVPVGRFVQLVAGPYSRRVHRRLGQSGGLFQRHRAILVVGDFYVLQLIRYIHWSPVRLGLTADPATHLWSSHRNYLGYFRRSWVTTSVVRRLLDEQPEKHRKTYSRWMREPLTENESLEFERSALCVPTRIVHRQWIDRVRSRASESTPAPGSLDRIIDAVSIRLDVSRAELVSRSRRQHATMARALVAWHALRNGLGTLNDVSRVLRRHPSTLTAAMYRYKKARADLFNEPLTTGGNTIAFRRK